MNDLERDLRELFDRKAVEGSTAPRPPERVKQRSRRRQMGVVAVGALTVVAVAAISVAGLRAIDRGSTAPRPAEPKPYDSGRYPIFERTATIENFTITSPSDWYLVNQWPLTQALTQKSGQTTCFATSEAVPAGTSGAAGTSGSSGRETCETTEPIEGSLETIPIFRLSNRDPGLDLPICNFGGAEAGLTGDAAVLQVSVDYAALGLPGGTTPDWPVGFDESTGITDGPCGEGHYARFMVGVVPYVAWVGFGPDATDQDRAQMLASFSSMAIEGRPQDPQQETAAYVIAGGENAAGEWRLELRRQTKPGYLANARLDLVTAEGSSVALGDPFTIPDPPIEQAGGDPTFGAVTKEAVGVELRPEGREPAVPATLVPLPPSMPFNFDLFFAEYDGDVRATAVPLGLGEASPSGPPSPTPGRDDVVTVEGTDPVSWTLKLSGSVEEKTACVDLDTKHTDFTPLCPGELPTDEPLVRIWSDSGQLFAAGSAPPGTLSVRAEGPADGGYEGVCVHGPPGWNGIDGFVVPLGSLEDGSIVFTTSVGPDTVPLDRATRQLPWNNEEGTITATGDFLGSPWRVEQLFYRDGLRVDVGGRIQSIEQPAVDEPVVLSLPDLSYGALVLVLTDLSVDEIDVTSEGRWYGRWMPSSTRGGDEARLWVVELPGAGSGALNYDGKNVGSVSWP
jgi:hypothetical protein